MRDIPTSRGSIQLPAGVASFPCNPMKMFGPIRLALIGCGLAATSAVFAAVTIPQAAQPQLAVGDDGRVWLVYGHGGDIFVARSDDGATTFGDPVKVTSLPKLMLGLRRGPRIAACGNDVTVTAVGTELIAFHSPDSGRTWMGPVTINTVPGCAREGLHDLAAAADGKMFVTWLDIRNGKMELWGADSSDAGRTWARNQQVYRSPDKSICECCHPNAQFDAEGNLAVMWRNSIGGFRDMWMATRAVGATRFRAARKLGEGGWKLDACPMDGGEIVALGRGRFAAVWQRAGEVFFSDPTGAEILLGKGKQPVAIARGGNPLVVWQQDANLVSMPVGTDARPVKHAMEARFAAMVPVAGGRGIVLAYEHGAPKRPDIVVERLP